MPFDRFDRLPRKSQSKPATPETAKPVVLVIDDDSRIRQALQFYLQKKYEVRLASNGKEGIEQVDEQVCVVILDIKMPKQDGCQVYNEIRAMFPQLPIIFYSGYQDVLERVKLSMTYKPFRYLNKNGEIQELGESIEKAIEYHNRMINLASLKQQLQNAREEKPSSG